MWLLIAPDRTTVHDDSLEVHDGSLEAFKDHWKEWLKTINESSAGVLNPLVFEVENYRQDESTGAMRVFVTFNLKVSVRGELEAGPIALLPAQLSLLRGQDDMWYLENGAPPEPAPNHILDDSQAGGEIR